MVGQPNDLQSFTHWWVLHHYRDFLPPCQVLGLIDSHRPSRSNSLTFSWDCFTPELLVAEHCCLMQLPSQLGALILCMPSNSKSLLKFFSLMVAARHSIYFSLKRSGFHLHDVIHSCPMASVLSPHTTFDNIYNDDNNKGRVKKNWKSGQADHLGWPPHFHK